MKQRSHATDAAWPLRRGTADRSNDRGEVVDIFGHWDVVVMAKRLARLAFLVVPVLVQEVVEKVDRQ